VGGKWGEVEEKVRLAWGSSSEGGNQLG